MGRIEIDFNNTIRQANELLEISDNIEKLSTRKMSTTIQMISQNWTSQSSNQFIIKSNIVKGNIEATSHNLEKVATNIKLIAKKVYQAEMRAKEIATTRNVK